ncbi:acetyl-CoA carboxylase biotin carboxyl carrier protein subunit [Raineya orbicola]|uniref:Biotin-requiring enzyme n=1 Tax=Raineya orbicola TaxID=2016530 RepID=A0A2N3IIZ5_9BACT|nr:biotin/lipoyl-containing protein [Raineya orbicola]PKQ70203.1 Biotin-requiring enzyme [Raineya orbicola]
MVKVKSNNANSQKEFLVEFREGKFFLNESPFTWDSVSINENTLHCLYENKSFVVEIVKADYLEKNFVLKINGKKYEYTAQTEMDLLLEKLGMQKSSGLRVGQLKAPMPGLIVDVRIAEGQQVQKGDVLLILEAMKMENAIKAPADATIKTICIKKGDSVEKNKVLIEFA